MDRSGRISAETSIASVPPAAIDETFVVFVHVFHLDIWAEMAAMLADAIDRPFALVLTSPDGASSLVLPDTPHLKAVSRIETENRGRDVLPFLTALRAVGPRFEIGLKLHTKRSVHREDGEAWRQFILASLLERDARAGDRGVERPLALEAMETLPELGLIAPRFHMLPLANRLMLNRRHLKTIMRRTRSAVPIRRFQTGSFAASTMFWFRCGAVQPLFEADLDELFVREAAQIEGTAAHALERLFAHIAETHGYLATAIEALGAVSAAAVMASGRPSLDDLRHASREALRPRDNPFIGRFRPFWENHPRLFEIYATLKHHTVERVGRRLRASRSAIAARSFRSSDR